MRHSLPIFVLLACAALAGCGSDVSPGEPLRLGSPAGITRSQRSHLVVIVLENRELGEVLGSSEMPYVNALARKSAIATDYHAIAHPSLPNYIALIAGDPLGVSSDCTECEAHGATLVDQLQSAGIAWRAYMEGLPRPCWPGASSSLGYAKKHDPFMYFSQISSNAKSCRNVVPLTALASQVRRDRLPPFAWISPNLCDDGHDCANRDVDAFLAHLVPYLIAGLGPHGLLALVWDEGVTESACCGRARGGRVPLILVGPSVRPGYRLSPAADHYSLLRLIEDSFGLAHLRGAACPCTPSLDTMFKTGRPPRLRK